MTREAWTDERMDDLVTRVDAGFANVDHQFERVDRRFEKVDSQFERVHAEIKALRAETVSPQELQAAIAGLRNEMEIRFEAVDERLNQLDKKFGKLEALFEKSDVRAQERFNALQQTLLLTGGGLIGTLIIGILSLIATQL